MSTTLAALFSFLAAIVVFLTGCMMVYIGIVFHELGHLCGCLLVGWKPLSVHFGAGPQKTFLRVGDLSFQAGLNPFKGRVRAVARQIGLFRLRFFVFIICGPLTTAVLIAGAWEIHSWNLAQPWLMLTQLFLLAQWILLASSLIPYKPLIAGKRTASDGLQMVRIMFMGKEQVADRFTGHCITLAQLRMKDGRNVEAEEFIKSALPKSANALDAKSIMICLLVTAGKKDEAKAMMEHLSRDPEDGGISRNDTLDMLACIPITFGQMELLDEAMACIDQAIAEEPDKITLKGTKASLLVEKGNLDGGMNLLKEVLAKSESKNDQAICKYYTALVHHRKGEVNRAYEVLREAQQIDPKCVVHKRIEAELAGKPRVAQPESSALSNEANPKSEDG